MEKLFWFVDGLLLVVAGLWNYGAHWTPWRVLPFLVDERGELRRMVAYVHGTFTILAVMGVWVWARCVAGQGLVDAWSMLGFLLAVTVAAGLGTLLPRVFRFVLWARHREGDLADYEQAVGG